MNHATRFTKLALLLILAGALALAGCGGDDGVDQGMHDMVVAERDAAQMAAAEAEEKARMEAEAKAEAEEKARMEAEARAMAEAEAEMAEEARIRAEAAAEAAAQAEMEAEAKAAMEEEERMKAAEDQREAEEKARMAEEARMKAEEDAAAAMKAAEDAETQAEMDEAARMMAEADRARLEAANMAARAGLLMTAMQNFIQDQPQNRAQRSAEGSDYGGSIPLPTGETADPTPLDDERVSAALPADLSIGDRVRPSVDGAPALSGVSLTHTEADGIMAAVTAPRGQEFTVVGYEKQDTMAPAIEGWDNQVLMRRNDADNADQLLYFYTDIAQDSGVSFLSRYQGTSVTITAANLGLASSPTFPTSATATPSGFTTPGRIFTAVNTPPFAGTFDGVPGVFTCTGTCNVRWNAANGSLALGTGTAGAVEPTYSAAGALTNGITFTPTDPTAAVMAGSDDFLYFGYWLHKPDAPGGAHQFMTFAGGLQPFVVRGDDPQTPAVEVDDATAATPLTNQISLVHPLTRTARFKGPAAGKYVTRNALTAEAMIGQFTATAELLADFDAGGSTATSGNTSRTRTDAPGMVTGVVRDFKDMNGVPLSNWRITLGTSDNNTFNLSPIGGNPSINEGTNRAATVSVDDSFNDKDMNGLSTTRFVGTTSARIGGGVITSINGTWSGRFYGNGRTDGHPDAIVGQFDAHADHASISGAFGAYNTDQ